MSLVLIVLLDIRVEGSLNVDKTCYGLCKILHFMWLYIINGVEH